MWMISSETCNKLFCMYFVCRQHERQIPTYMLILCVSSWVSFHHWEKVNNFFDQTKSFVFFLYLLLIITHGIFLSLSLPWFLLVHSNRTLCYEKGPVCCFITSLNVFPHSLSFLGKKHKENKKNHQNWIKKNQSYQAASHLQAQSSLSQIC